MESRRAAQFGLGLALLLLVACLSMLIAGSRPPEQQNQPGPAESAKVTATGSPVAPR
jgi:hypothetical protein